MCPDPTTVPSSRFCRASAAGPVPELSGSKRGQGQESKGDEQDQQEQEIGVALVFGLEPLDWLPFIHYWFTFIGLDS